MSEKKQYTIKLDASENRQALRKSCWLVILNANQTPPHIGMLFNGLYSSLTIKGKELDLDLATLLRRIDIQKKKAVFIKLNPHPVFSTNFLQEYFNDELKKFDKVTAENTCFAPVRTFMQENYLLKQEELDYMYEMFPLLYHESMIDTAFGMNLAGAREYNFVKYQHKDIVNQLNAAGKSILVND